MRNSAIVSRTSKTGWPRREKRRAKRPSMKWKRSGRTPNAMIEVRALQEHDEFADAVRLQQLIWGFDDVELLPVRLFVTATKIGGQAFGAYDTEHDCEKMGGFCLAIPG